MPAAPSELRWRLPAGRSTARTKSLPAVAGSIYYLTGFIEQLPDHAMLATAPASARPIASHYQRGRVGINAGHRASLLATIEALSLASGRQLVKTIPAGAHQRVAFVVKPSDERTLDFRLRSALNHHGLTLADIGDRLGFLLVDGHLEDARPTLQAIVSARHIDVLFVDEAFSGEVDIWRDIARTIRVAVMLVLPDADLDNSLVSFAASVRLARAFHGSLCQVNDIKLGSSCIVSL